MKAKRRRGIDYDLLLRRRNEFYHRCASYLRLIRMKHQDFEDVFADAVLQLCEAVTHGQVVGDVDVFIDNAVISAAKAWNRQRGRVFKYQYHIRPDGSSVWDHLAKPEDQSPFNGMTTSIMYTALYDAIPTLPRLERICMEEFIPMWIDGGRTNRELAGRMGRRLHQKYSVLFASTTLSRARSTLWKRMQEMGIVDEDVPRLRVSNYRMTA